MKQKNPYRVLGLENGAPETKIKAAYRKLALRYHPDRNSAPEAAGRFQEINEAYEFLLEHGGETNDVASGYEDVLAREIYRKEKQHRQQQARARYEKKKREEAFLDRPEWHDPILIARYLMHGLGLLIALAAVVAPALIAILGNPASLAGTFFFIIAGIVLCSYIYQRRRAWFRLGRLKTTWKDLTGFFVIRPVQKADGQCCYCNGLEANGKPYRIELLKTMDIKMRSFGVMNHQVKYKNYVRRIEHPRSARAMVIHRLTSLAKVCCLLAALLFFPVESFAWKFLAGLAAGFILSAAMLALSATKSKVSYLFTPGLLIKAAVWLGALYLISEFGPGMEVRTSGYVYLVLTGLLFLLDILFDLLFGLFPFYHRLFRPIVKQGKIMDGLYRDGYQNYQEFPVYSSVYPFFRWLL